MTMQTNSRVRPSHKVRELLVPDDAAKTALVLGGEPVERPRNPRVSRDRSHQASKALVLNT